MFQALHIPFIISPLSALLHQPPPPTFHQKLGQGKFTWNLKVCCGTRVTMTWLCWIEPMSLDRRGRAGSVKDERWSLILHMWLIFSPTFLKESQLDPFVRLQAKGSRKASPGAKAHSVKWGAWARMCFCLSEKCTLSGIGSGGPKTP